ncbi:hypothetical protein ABIQ69_00665 [Agromyces sp. G08B096]|uniref:DUF3558 domain-containing protein n=1 Tax=Agromyces sp. G08B096 TaxID=3156399 RepID=A0AAU7W8D3_9MICO
MSRTRPIAALTAAIAIGLLAACTSTPATTAPPVASADPSSSPTETPAAEPTDAPAGEPTCETVLTAPGADALAADGLVLASEPGFLLGPAMEDLVADGALACTWTKPQSDIAVWFARLPEPDDAWQARQAALVAEGWQQTDAPLPGTLTAPADYDANYAPSIVHIDGVTVFVSYADFLSSVAEAG